MTKEEIIEGNKLIAEFMGLSTMLNAGDGYTFPFPITHGDFDSLYQTDCGFGEDLIYHESWDWIIPVVEKIQSLGAIDFVISVGHSVVVSWDDGTAYFEQTKGSGNKSIETVYAAVILFIKWYNNDLLTKLK